MSEPLPEVAIAITGLDKRFRRFQHPGWRALDALGWPVPRTRYDHFQALTGINLSIARGEKVALIGRNGAGKSTLLRLIAGQMRADAGTVQVNGQVQALMTLGTGFHPDFTGLENIRSALAYQGVSPADMAGHIEDIIEFTELDEFLERPVKEYSAGMYARLTFAVATCITPDILIIDEILGAGDAYFLGKCIQRMKALTQDGATILFVSHDMSSVQMLCDRGIWLDAGRIRQDGPLLPVSKAYLASIREQEERRLRARSMALTKGQASAIERGGQHISLLRLVGQDGVPPSAQALVRGIGYGDVHGELGHIDLAGSQSAGGSALLVDVQHMNWQRVKPEPEESPAWAFGDFGGRYQHAPFQIVWPARQMPTDAWVQLELRASASAPVLLEQYMPEDNAWHTLTEISPDSSPDWHLVRTPLQWPDGAPTTSASSQLAGLIADLQPLNSHDRYGIGGIKINGFGFFDADNTQRHTLVSGEAAFALIGFAAEQPVLNPVPVIAIYRPDGTCAMQVIASLSGQSFERLEGSGAIRVEFAPLLLGPGDYLVSVALFRDLNLASNLEPVAFDLHDRCYPLKILQPAGIGVEIGVVNQPVQWELVQ